MEPLKIAFVTSEMAPFAKTGGLADVAAALPAHLCRQGHDVRVFMPLYSAVDRGEHAFVPVDFLQDLHIPMGAHTLRVSVRAVRMPDAGGLDVYFIDCPELYHHRCRYTGGIEEHLRFALLCHAAIRCCQHMGWGPDVLHCNDWHAALLPLYLKTVYAWDRLFARTRTVLTIHNIAYQGVFPAEVVGTLGLWDHRHLLFQDDLERGAIGFLKTGILYADVVTTVSRTYAREIQTAAFGMGLEGVLRQRSSTVMGIVNGVDYGTWDPRNDPHLPHTYGIDDAEEGKAANKAYLLRELGLPPADAGQPLLGIVSRLTAQKGFELLEGPLPELLRHLDVRCAFLGTGEPALEGFFQQLQGLFPEKVCYYRGYNEPLAHLIEAASDIFLMPSRFEPCGLNQMYSLRYGTAPLVRKTGGLADTVTLWDPEAATGTGFVFEHFDVQGITWALKLALTTYRDRAAWATLRRNGMEQDFSWDRQGAEYERLYGLLVDRA